MIQDNLELLGSIRNKINRFNREEDLRMNEFLNVIRSYLDERHVSAGVARKSRYQCIEKIVESIGVYYNFKYLFLPACPLWRFIVFDSADLLVSQEIKENSGFRPSVRRIQKNAAIQKDQHIVAFKTGVLGFFLIMQAINLILEDSSNHECAILFLKGLLSCCLMLLFSDLLHSEERNDSQDGLVDRSLASFYSYFFPEGTRNQLRSRFAALRLNYF